MIALAVDVVFWTLNYFVSKKKNLKAFLFLMTMNANFFFFVFAKHFKLRSNYHGLDFVHRCFLREYFFWWNTLLFGFYMKMHLRSAKFLRNKTKLKAFSALQVSYCMKFNCVHEKNRRSWLRNTLVVHSRYYERIPLFMHTPHYVFMYQLFPVIDALLKIYRPQSSWANSRTWIACPVISTKLLQHIRKYFQKIL